MKKKKRSMIAAFGGLACLLLLLPLLLGGCGAAPTAPSNAGRTREFTDSLGRKALLPETLDRVALTGPLTQLYVYPLCPDRLAGFSGAFSVNAEKYIPEKYRALPDLGQLHGGAGTMNLEELIAVSPDAVIDVGERKNGMVEDFDRLAEKTGIPFLHIDADVLSAPKAFRTLGRLTGDTEQAERLAVWCERALEQVNACMKRVDAEGKRKKVLYCMGGDGQSVLAKGSYHAQIVDLCAENCAVTDRQVSGGDGSPADMEQILLWDPDVILFRHDSIGGTAADSATWRQLRAIQSGDYYSIPCGPYGWLSSPPAVQCYLGLLWLTDTLYPEYTDYDLKEEVTEYYRLFYGYELSKGDYDALINVGRRKI